MHELLIVVQNGGFIRDVVTLSVLHLTGSGWHETPTRQLQSEMAEILRWLFQRLITVDFEQESMRAWVVLMLGVFASIVSSMFAESGGQILEHNQHDSTSTTISPSSAG